MKRDWPLDAARTLAVCAAIAFVLLMNNSKSVRAGDDQGDENEQSLVIRGFQVAPVPLNLENKNRALVGLGRYLVNVVGDCNGCHSAGPPSEFTNDGNPYKLFPKFFSGKKEINTATYLGGGRDFGPFANLPHLYSRNLTPDFTGRPEGGRTYAEFVEIMRHGTDLDHVHPNCTADNPPANCLNPPFDGNLLQVMRWPSFQNMTDRELQAMYEYLKAIQCNPGQVKDNAPYLLNTCQQ